MRARACVRACVYDIENGREGGRVRLRERERERERESSVLLVYAVYFVHFTCVLALFLVYEQNYFHIVSVCEH